MKEVNILVVKREDLSQDLFVESFTTITEKRKESILRHATYQWRPDMEEDDRFKQIIPYVIVRIDDRILLYRRGEKSNEERLKSQYSVAVGGHIDQPDTLLQAACREVQEEIGVTITESDLQIVGIINDDRTEVNRVHIGIVMVVNLPFVAFDKLEEGVIDDCQLCTVEEIEKVYDQCETWSQIVIDAYLKK